MEEPWERLSRLNDVLFLPPKPPEENTYLKWAFMFTHGRRDGLKRFEEYCLEKHASRHIKAAGLDDNSHDGKER